MSEEIIKLELLLHYTMLMILKNLMKKQKKYMKELFKKYDDMREKDTPTKIPQNVKKKDTPTKIPQSVRKKSY